MKKETWKTLIQILVSILTAIGTTLGVTSCMGYGPIAMLYAFLFCRQFAPKLGVKVKSY